MISWCVQPWVRAIVEEPFCEDSSPYKGHGANSRYRDPSEAFTDLRARNSKGEHIKNWACEDVHGVLVASLYSSIFSSASLSFVLTKTKVHVCVCVCVC